MNLKKEKFYLEPEYLSNVELYFSEKIDSNQIIIEGEESHHISKVMRHKADDLIYVTDGKGIIYNCSIFQIENNLIYLNIISKKNYINFLGNFTICIPKLKSHERLEFALEKCVELGFTNFIIYESLKSISKFSKIERWNKIVVSAMKQSLRAFLPSLEIINNLKDFPDDGNIVVFEQNSSLQLADYTFIPQQKYYLLFGPEGGFDKKEFVFFEEINYIKLTENRLRAETAIVTAASFISLSLTK